MSAAPPAWHHGYVTDIAYMPGYYRTQSPQHLNLACLLGGMAAEELTFGESTTGPQNDLERASQIARSMVCDFGMSAGVGPVAFNANAAPRQDKLSEMSAEAIDREVRRYVSQAQSAAREILETRHDRLVHIAERLIEEETLTAAQFEELFTGARLETTSPVPDLMPAPVPMPVPATAEVRQPVRRVGVPALAAAVRRDPFAKSRPAALRRLAANAPRLLGLGSEDSAAAEG